MSTTEGATPSALGPYLARSLGDPAWAEPTVSLITGGKSNLTYRIESTSGRLVLRRPPLGHMLPTAHDMRREFRVMSALADTAVPVPRMRHFCDDPTVLGHPFYVMELVEGHVVRGALPSGYADGVADRRQVSERLIDVLVALHGVDAEEVGLADFGRPDGYLARQLNRWSRQWQASRTDDLGALDALGAELAAQLPVTQLHAVIHGDYRLDNTVLDPDDVGRVRAVLDWEMSTLGDPLADLGVLLVYWDEATDTDARASGLIVPSVTGLPGMLLRQEVADRYATATGLDLGPLPWYVAFGFFKLAVVCAGIAMRSKARAMVGAGFEGFEALVPTLVDLGRTTLAERALVRR